MEITSYEIRAQFVQILLNDMFHMIDDDDKTAIINLRDEHISRNVGIDVMVNSNS